MGALQGKRKRAHDPIILMTGEEFNVDNLSNGGHRDHVMHIKDGGIHESV